MTHEGSYPVGDKKKIIQEFVSILFLFEETLQITFNQIVDILSSHSWDSNFDSSKMCVERGKILIFFILNWF